MKILIKKSKTQIYTVISFFAFAMGMLTAPCYSAVKSEKQYITEEEATNIRIYKNANRAVVNVSAINAVPQDFAMLIPEQGNGGSGIIIDTDGHILTNYHVIEHASTFRVTIYDGTTLPANIVGVDPNNDLAVLQINPPPGIKLTTIPFGDSSGLEVGRRVLAIGNPFGLDRTLTQGIISSLGRTLRTENNRLIKGIIQTDAAINPGNSGGPLLDTQGKLIGMNTAIASRAGQSAGIGLAIPINIIKTIVPQLIAHHKIVRADLGIRSVTVLDRGLQITALEPNGSAAEAGIKGPKLSIYKQGGFTFQVQDTSAADVITNIDNVSVHSVDDLLSYLELKKPGQVVTLTVLRGDQKVKVDVRLKGE
jgi:S1-C subfamily serine protease